MYSSSFYIYIYIYPYNYLAKHSFLSQYSHRSIFSFFLISLTLISINVTPVMMVKCLCLELYPLLPSSKSFCFHPQHSSMEVKAELMFHFLGIPWSRENKLKRDGKCFLPLLYIFTISILLCCQYHFHHHSIITTTLTICHHHYTTSTASRHLYHHLHLLHRVHI